MNTLKVIYDEYMQTEEYAKIDKIFDAKREPVLNEILERIDESARTKFREETVHYATLQEIQGFYIGFKLAFSLFSDLKQTETEQIAATLYNDFSGSDTEGDSI